MKILYVAKHDGQDNDDEGAISYAMRVLGHTVYEVPEKSAASWMSCHSVDVDLVLFHKWPELERQGPRLFPNTRYRDAPRVFWYFDLVDSKDPTLMARAAYRVRWMNTITPLCLLGFCTDGDWVKRDRTGKLRLNMQGADERYAGIGNQQTNLYHPILFTGMVRHGQDREFHIKELKELYGEAFCVFGDAGPRQRLHGHALRDLLCSADVVLAPDGPQSDLYWSNRVYLTLGFGGFLLHPWCDGLTQQYTPGRELIMYEDHTQCRNLIDHYRDPDNAAERKKIALAGHQKTLSQHLYRHRVSQLLATVKDALR
jgi:hypothetical protein